MSLRLNKTYLLVILAVIVLGVAFAVSALPRFLINSPPAAEPRDPSQATPMRGDLDGDGDVDQNDLNIILAARNTKATGPNDPRDLNQDGKIDALDARVLTMLCTRMRCALESVTWSEPQLEVVLSPGETTTRTVSFSMDANLQNVVVEAVPEIAGFLSIQPNSFENLPANQPQQVTINFAIPSGAPLGPFEGTIHVRSGSQTLPATLKVVVNVWHNNVDAFLGIAFKTPLEWQVRFFSPPTAEESEAVLVGLSGSRMQILPEGGFAYGLDPDSILEEKGISLAGKPAVRADYRDSSGRLFLVRITFDPPVTTYPNFRVDFRPTDLQAEVEFEKILETLILLR